VPAAAFAVVAVSGTIALALTARRVLRANDALVLLLFVALLYIGVLGLDEFKEYLETGQPVAINGRYLIPVLLPLAAVLGRALSLVLQAWPRVKLVAAALVLLLFLQGGGLFSFILRSDATWYWPNRAVVQVNNAARSVVSPFVFESSKTY
jgi:hypothetical protein